MQPLLDHDLRPGIVGPAGKGLAHRFDRLGRRLRNRHALALRQPVELDDQRRPVAATWSSAASASLKRR